MLDALLFGKLHVDPGAWGALFLQFALLSMLAIGGAITTVSEMHRFVVGERGWLDDTVFAGSVALAQAAPGPNVLFVAVIGFNVGGLAGMTATLAGSVLPSSALTMALSRWSAQRRDHPGLRAFTQGLAPVSIGLLVATSWVLTEPARTHWGTVPLVAGSVLFMLKTRRSPVWAIALGALAGIFGFV